MTPIEITVIGAGVLFIFKTIVEFLSKIVFRSSNKIGENTIAITELSVNMKHLSDKMTSLDEKLGRIDAKLSIVDKLSTDIHYAHEKLRDLQNEA